MCVSLFPAHLSGTRLMGHVIEQDGVPHHVIGYQNTAQNLHPGANAMVLPIPAVGEVTQENFLDTSHAPRILADMVAATTRTSRGGSRSASGTAMTVFNHGLYSIAVGREVTKEGLAEALSRVPADRRPELNWDVLGAYPQLYPDYTQAFCCFNTREIAEAGPLLYHYQPLDPSKLFLPALDAHDGRRPVPGAPVSTDHDLLVGSTTGQPVNYRDRLGDLAKYLPRWVLRAAVSDWLPNGDFTVNTADLNRVGSDVRAIRSYGGLQYALSVKG